MTYTDAFFELETEVAYTSANVVLPVILGLTNAKTVIDIGCGTGAWAAVAADLGCVVRGVDKDVPEHLQLVPVINHDLNKDPYPCEGWDLAICLEVAEHLQPEAGDGLVEGLAQAGAVLFSAATPGQPGVGHIHCQPHAYWHGLFWDHGLRANHVGGLFDEPCADFYRRNMYLYRRGVL